VHVLAYGTIQRAMLEPKARSTSAAAARLAFAIVLSILIAALAVLRSGPPAVLSADAAPELGSGARALEVLAGLVGDGAPRPTGSVANRAARARLVAHLERLGLEASVQETFATRTERGGLVCGPVTNVLARLAGSRGRGSSDLSDEASFGALPCSAILCVAHYDSVAAGPGVADDLAGVAAWLEVARAIIASGRPTARDVLFLFSDAEEPGLLGAEAFAAEHPWFAEVGVVLNLEARGTGGPSRMFETGPDNDWIAGAFARGASQPSTTSLATALYREMPNDTDFSVFRKRAIPGLNFAWIGGVSRYHTPLDDLAHLDPRSLQHHVTNGLDAVRALDSADWRAPGSGSGDAVFSDVFRWKVLFLRTDLARALALGALLCTLVGLTRACRSGATTGGRAIGGMLGAVLLVAAVVAMGFGAGAAFEAVAGVARPWRAHPFPAVLGILGAALFGVVLMTPLVARGATDAVAVGLGGFVVLAASTFVLTLLAPGLTAPLLAPVLLVALVVALARFEGDGSRSIGWAALFGAAVATVFVAPLGVALVDAYGLTTPTVAGPPLGAVLGGLLGLWVLFAAPLFAGAGAPALMVVGGLGAVAAVFGAVMMTLMPAVSPMAPGRLVIRYAAEHGAESAAFELHMFGDPAPPALLERGTFRRVLGGVPSASSVVMSAPAPAGLVGFVELEDLRFEETADGTLFQGRLTAPEGALDWSLRGANLEVLTVEGHVAPNQLARIVAPPAGGVVVAGRIRSEERAAMFVGRGVPQGPSLRIEVRRPGLPREANHLLSARPASFVPAGSGDGVVMTRWFVLAP